MTRGALNPHSRIFFIAELLLHIHMEIRMEVTCWVHRGSIPKGSCKPKEHLICSSLFSMTRIWVSLAMTLQLRFPLNLDRSSCDFNGVLIAPFFVVILYDGSCSPVFLRRSSVFSCTLSQHVQVSRQCSCSVYHMSTLRS